MWSFISYLVYKFLKGQKFYKTYLKIGYLEDKNIPIATKSAITEEDLMKILKILTPCLNSLSETKKKDANIKKRLIDRKSTQV